MLPLHPKTLKNPSPGAATQIPAVHFMKSDIEMLTLKYLDAKKKKMPYGTSERHGWQQSYSQY